jgi:hypothetical protein
VSEMLAAIYQCVDVCLEHGVKANRVRMSRQAYQQLKSECTYSGLEQLEREGLHIIVVDNCPPDNLYVDYSPEVA